MERPLHPGHLPQGEGQSQPVRSAKSAPMIVAQDWDTVLPLPEGEGREGEEGVMTDHDSGSHAALAEMQIFL